MPGRGGCVCPTKPGSLVELTTVSSFESGSSWKLVKSGSKAESTGRRGEAIVKDSRIRKEQMFICTVKKNDVGNKKCGNEIDEKEAKESRTRSARASYKHAAKEKG